MPRKIYTQYKNFTPFTEQEAWMLFKIAAIGEGVGWTLLILGILFRDIWWPGNPYTVALAGKVHGVLFLLYIVAVLLFSPSLRWSFVRTIIAGLCSVPPYGSILFELFTGEQRNLKNMRTFYHALYLHALRTQTMQPAK